MLVYAIHSYYKKSTCIIQKELLCGGYPERYHVSMLMFNTLSQANGL